MDFDYRRSTKEAYKDAGVAKEYHEAFNKRLTWRNLRARLIAEREKRVIGSLLDSIAVKKVLDIPCGTGKLAPVMAARGYSVVAADISKDMLTIAQQSYSAAAVKEVEFAIGDAEKVYEQWAGREIDAVVCLRLMHRVPESVRQVMLSEISKLSRYAIISFGVNARYHRIRKKLRYVLFPEPEMQLCLTKLNDIHKELAQHFRVISQVWVAPFLSEEIVFLVESRLKQ